MIKRIEINEFLNGETIIDVRSPGEFEKGHVPGAVNLPLFSNEERADVGTLYKQKGREEAVLRGLKYVGPKQEDFLSRALKWSKGEGKLNVYCWRGGMRSNSMAWLFTLGGIEVNVLEKGYKAYRNWVLEQFSKQYNLLVLGGRTGSAKTEILHEIKALGEQVIDLEGLANHKGSAFGGIDQEKQPSTEFFENNLALELSKMDRKKRIWLEDESEMIGHVNINHAFFEQKRSAKTLFIERGFESRVSHLVKSYGKASIADLKVGVEKIKKRLGGLNYKEAIEALDNGDLAKTAELCLRYYDKAYDFSLAKKDQSRCTRIEIKNTEIEGIARELIRY